MKKSISFLLAGLLASSTLSAQVRVAHDPNAKTFAASDKVTTEKVSYHNRHGIQIVADVYYPKGLDMTQKHPAIRHALWR